MNIYSYLSYYSASLRTRDAMSENEHYLWHSFAVRSLEQCGNDRNAVRRHMLALSTYLGHTSISDTYWYLEATPALLRTVAQAAECAQMGRDSR